TPKLRYYPGQSPAFESIPRHTAAGGRLRPDRNWQHVIVILTIWNADAETKVHWRSRDNNALRTTVIPGRASKHFEHLESSDWRPSQLSWLRVVQAPTQLGAKQ